MIIEPERACCRGTCHVLDNGGKRTEERASYKQVLLALSGKRTRTGIREKSERASEKERK